MLVKDKVRMGLLIGVKFLEMLFLYMAFSLASSLLYEVSFTFYYYGLTFATVVQLLVFFAIRNDKTTYFNPKVKWSSWIFYSLGTLLLIDSSIRWVFIGSYYYKAPLYSAYLWFLAVGVMLVFTFYLSPALYAYSLRMKKDV